ncbi:MAG: DsbA family protein [Hyphomicrobiaceae bacterium]|nr:DsbA family protein [Hyphomicrobiaceae bacterium]
MAASLLAQARSLTTSRTGIAVVLSLATAAGFALAALTSGDRATAQTSAVSEAAEAAKGAPFTDEQKAGIRAIVRDYLLQNPELFLDVQTELEKKLEEIQSARLKTSLKENSADIFRRPDAPMAGNPNGDVTVVEFFDYNCGFCKRGFPEVAKLIDSDSKVKVIFKELPILSKASEEASRVALAAKKQGKYWEVHRDMLNSKGRLDEETALKIAGKLGLDTAKLKADMNAPDVTAEIEKVREIAQKMGINGTPHFLVGDRSIAGAPENLHEQLAEHVKAIRASGGCDVC